MGLVKSQAVGPRHTSELLDVGVGCVAGFGIVGLRWQKRSIKHAGVLVPQVVGAY